MKNSVKNAVKDTVKDTGTIGIACLAVLLSCGREPTRPPPAQPEIPISGAAVPGMASYDQTIRDFMRKFSIPGGAVIIPDARPVFDIPIT